MTQWVLRVICAHFEYGFNQYVTHIKAIYEHFTRSTCGTFWNSVGQFLHFKSEKTEAKEEGSFAQGHTVSR